MEHYRNKKEHSANRKLKDISGYENVNTRVMEDKKYEMYLDFDNYIGWYSYKDILDMKECNMSYSQLNKRVNNLLEKMGAFMTMKDVITIKPLPKSELKIKNMESFHKRAELKKKMMEEIDEFKDFMRLMPVGSLSNSYRRMQSIPIK